ncbi:MAG: hypothetical protein KAS07_05600 [Candidatus Pacebacteria bacterium]|nr:hypothetical protein [Candidatus Paceibacterota bacterium]
MCEKTYIECIKNLADRRSDFDIPNTGVKHKKNMLEAMIANSGKEINIFEPAIDDEEYDDDIINSIIAFLRYYKRKGKLTIIVDRQKEDEVKDTLLYKQLKDWDVLKKVSIFCNKKW